MQQLVTRIDRWHSLNAKARDFFGRNSAVDHRMPNVPVQKGHHIERLHDIRAIGAGERNIRAKFDGALQRLDAADDAFIGQLAFAVSIENRQYQGREFVPSRDSVEPDAGRGTVLEQVELDLRHFGALLDDSQVGTCRGQ